MDGFDTNTMTYLATVMPPPTSQDNNDGYNQHLMPLDHYSNYDVNTFVGSEDLSTHPMQNYMPPISPLPKHLSASLYEEAFSDAVSAFDIPAPTEDVAGDSPSIARDHELLSFSQPTFDHVLLNHFGGQITLSLAAQLHGMFFLAELHLPKEEQAVAPLPAELTCYRRNLFQVTGNVILPRSLRYIYTDHGQQVPILGQELAISATESTEGNPVKLISVPWKTPTASSQANAEDKAEKEPLTVSLDFMTAQNVDGDYASFPFQWKRLQFRIATANNGRRKELQQHFVLHIKIMATLATGQKVQLCETHSGAIIVRGRSPRNFSSRKDMPLNGAGSHARKPSSQTAQLLRPPTNETPHKQLNNAAPTSASVKQETFPPAMSVQSYFEPNDLHITPEIFNNLLANPVPHTAMTALPHDSIPFDMNGVYAISSPDIVTKVALPKSTPINLSLVEDEPTSTSTPTKPTPDSANAYVTTNPNATKPTASSRQKRPFAPPPRPPSFNLNTIASPDESADSLYEYFPLGLDDWMPPVDAVYRPHVVHHINVTADPRDPKAVQGGGRSKRYFSESEGLGP